MTGLVADIGSTNARFALVSDAQAASSPSLTKIAHYDCASFPTLTDAIAAYLKTLPADQIPKRATLGVAAPASEGRIRLTNHHWEFSAAEIQAQLKFDSVRIINDFTSVALSLGVLPKTSMIPIGPTIDLSHAKTFGLVGPGTGLGVSGLLRVGKQSIPLPSEGGHISFAATNDIELDIARVLIGRFGHVSNERLLSGQGLVNIYETLHTLSGARGVTLTPEQITERGLAGTDATCRKTLGHFCAILGSIAGDMALLLNADAIYVGGGIVPRMIDFLRASEFRTRFEKKGRFADRLARIPVLLITEPYPGLLGAAVDLLQHS